MIEQLTKEVHGDDTPVALAVVLDLIGAVEVGDGGLSRLQAGGWRVVIHACQAKQTFRLLETPKEKLGPTTLGLKCL